MTSEEIKNAMHQFAPVRYNGVRYDRITAYIYRAVETQKRGKYKIVLQCELLDLCGNSVTVAEAEKVELVNDEHSGNAERN